MSMTTLAQNKCEACSGLTPKLTPEQLAEFTSQVDGWEIVDGHHMVKHWKFGNFAEALDRVNAIGTIAEEEGHHPDVRFGWGYLEITLFTHEMNSLSKNDFIMAAKIDLLFA